MNDNETEVLDTLLTTEWLEQHLGEPDLVVLDCSVETNVHDDGTFSNISGKASFDAGHIPTAGFADLKGALCDKESQIEFALPSPEQFCQAMGALGVGDNSRVVLYDNSLSAWAARVWWMLRWVGFDRAAILDGGLKAWIDEDRPLSQEPSGQPARKLSPSPRPELIADKEEVQKAIGDSSVTLIDTLPPEYYRGEITMYARPGHIPGSINLYGIDLLDETGHYKPSESLQALHKMSPDKRVITYCGGGILASSNAFILTRLGYKDVAVYTASLQEWAADPSNPMMTGDA